MYYSCKEMSILTTTCLQTVINCRCFKPRESMHVHASLKLKQNNDSISMQAFYIKAVETCSKIRPSCGRRIVQINVHEIALTQSREILAGLVALDICFRTNQ